MYISKKSLSIGAGIALTRLKFSRLICLRYRLSCPEVFPKALTAENKAFSVSIKNVLVEY